MKMNKTYKEGDWLVIPLANSGYALGVIARAAEKSAYALGYFFPKQYLSHPSYEAAAGLRAKDAVLIAWFSDVGIKNGDWSILRNIPPFLREQWPVPQFVRPDLLYPEMGYLIEYDQEEPLSSRPIRETICDAGQLAGLPLDEKYGHVALVKKLSLITN